MSLVGTVIALLATLVVLVLVLWDGRPVIKREARLEAKAETDSQP